MADETAIIQALRNAAAVTAIVESRIYSELRTEGDPIPAITVELISGTPVNYLGSNPSQDRRLMLVTCYAKNRRESRSLGYVVREVLQPLGYLLNEGPVAYDDVLKSWQTQLEFSFWQRR